MTSTQPDPKPTVPGMKLQRMQFSPAGEDNQAVVYRAAVENPDGVCTLTVTAAAELYHTEELDKFLDEVWAGFVLTAPNVTKDKADDSEPEPNDLARETVIEIDVQLNAPDDTSDVIVEVIATAEKDDSESAEVRSAGKGRPPVGNVVQKPLGPGIQKRWYAPGGRSKTATASAIQGNGTLRIQSSLKPNQYLGAKKKYTARSVWVRGGSARLVYDLIY